MSNMDSVMTMTAMTTIDGDGPYECEVEIIQQVEMVRSMGASKPDAEWSLTDATGHFHAYTAGGGLPTLRAEHRHVPCAGSCDPPCEGYEVAYYVCKICGEEIEPLRVPDYQAQSVGIPIQGTKSATVTVHTDHPLPRRTVSLHIVGGGEELFGIGDLRRASSASDGTGSTEIVARFLEPRLTR
jgi:hypothetical protein